MSSTFIIIIRNTILFLSLYTSTLSVSLSPDLHFPPRNDAASLLAFESQADPGNKFRYSVNKTSAVCKWPGVECQTDGKVVRLVLESLNLAGVFAHNTLTQMDQLRVLSLRNNSLTGTIPDLAGFVNLKALYLDHNFFTGMIPLSVSSLHRLRILDLSYNILSGVIPVELSNLDRLNYLRLDSNRFSGSIPPFKQSLLEIFNVSVNFLTGPVPATPTLARFGPSLFSINPRLCGEIVRTKCGTNGPFLGKNSTNKPSSSPPEVVRGQSLQTEQMEDFRNSKSLKHKRIVLIIGFAVGLLIVITSILCVIMSMKKTSEKKKKRKEVVSAREMMEMAEAADAAAEVIRMQEANELEHKVKMLHQGIATKKSGNLVFCTGESNAFTVEQLMRASAELLDTGTTGTTYKAVVDNRVTVCVKRLNASRLTVRTNEAFERHMEVIGRLRHPNVVALGAYFQTKEEKLLVYDYQPNGSLFSLIHSKSTMAKPLHWTSCLKIAEDVAQGLCYLHQTFKLAHGNLKSSNVVLGCDFEARLSDSCLSTLLDGDGDSAAYEQTVNSDVYAFGVVLLELLTGKGALGHLDLTPDDVVKWVKSSRVGGVEMEEKRLEMMTEVVIACCCVVSPAIRPTMWQVIKMLQEIKEAAVMEDCGLDS